MANTGSQSDDDAQDPVAPELAERVEALVARGLERYGDGDLDGALGEWEHALALVPEHAGAQEYIDYVRQNFDVLDEQFQRAKDVARASTEAGVPLGADDADDAESDDYGYEAIEVTGAGDDAGGPDLDDTGLVAPDLGLEDLPEDDADTIQAPAVRSPFGLADARPEAEDGWAIEGGAGGANEVLTLDDAPYRKSAGSGPPPPEAGANESVSTRAESSFQLSSVSSDVLDLDLGGLPGPRGVALRTKRGGAGGGAVGASDGDEEQTVPGGQTPPPLAEHPPISQDVLDAIESVAEELERDRTGEHEDTADFDKKKLRQLDGAPPDDRHAPGPSAGVNLTFHDVGTSEKTVPSRPSAAQIDFSGLDIGSGADPAVDLDDLPSAAELGLGESPASSGATPDTSAGLVGSWLDFGAVDPLSDDAAAGADHDLDGLDDDGLDDDGLDDDGDDDDRDDDNEATRQRSFTGPGAERAPTRDPALAAVLSDLTDGQSELEGTGADLDAAGSTDDDTAATREHVAIRPLELDGELGPDNVDEVARRVRERLDDDAPPDESESERTRRRVQAMLDRARIESLAERDLLAAAVAELAVAESPDSAVGQKLIARHREMLVDIFRTYVGNLDATPMVTVPMHQVAELDIDSRAAFLLSRIDGTLSFEEILDVCGMPELEAFRHICRLLISGILEVR